MWYTYMIRCEDGTLYTGVTTDLERRFKEHSGEKKSGAKYTASHRPVRYEAAWSSENRTSASKLEYRIKKLGRAEKLRLIGGETPPEIDFSGYIRADIPHGGDSMTFICYSKCSTCKKAQSFLEEKGADFAVRDIKTENPTEEELRRWHAGSGLPLKKFFNTSGMQYRALELTKKLPEMTEDEQFKLLSSDGMLVKRPILVGEDFVLVGFKQTEWEEKL